MISRHLFTLAAANGASAGTLKPLSASLELNERYSPYCRATFTVAMPNDAVLALLNPRGGTVAGVFTVRYRDPIPASAVTALIGAPVTVADVTAYLAGRPISAISDAITPAWNQEDRAGVTLPFRLRVDEVTPDYKRGTVDITASSFESRLQEYPYPGTGVLLAPGQNIGFVTRLVVRTVIAGTEIEREGITATLPEEVTWAEGTTAWDFLDSILQPAGLTLQCTEIGVWRLIPANATPTTTYTLDRPTAIEPRDNRDDWADAAVVVYEWSDGTTTHKQSDITYSGNPQKIMIVRHTDIVYPGPGAAAQLLARAQKQGHDLNVEAVSDYTVHPGQAIAVSSPVTEPETARITAVSFTWPENRMRITTQEDGA